MCSKISEWWKKALQRRCKLKTQRLKVLKLIILFRIFSGQKKSALLGSVFFSFSSLQITIVTIVHVSSFAFILYH